MKNELSNGADAKAEDLIRAMQQFGSAEMHAKSLYEQTVAQMENGLVDVDDPDELKKTTDKANYLLESIEELSQLRRNAAYALFNMYDGGDEKMWCLVKHLGIGSMQAFETYQASDDDPALLQLAIDANKAFNKALTAFIGAEITDCAACLGDYLKATS